MSSENRFYVYMYLRGEKSSNGDVGTPYYIGKGTRNRAFKKDRKRGGIRVPKLKENIIIVADNLPESIAFEMEMELIQKYGRLDLGKGPLRNKTNGGEGNCGAIHSDEHKRRIKEAHTKSGRIKPVQCLETGEVFESATEAAKTLFQNGISNSYKSIQAKISAVCLKKRPTAYGYTWKFVFDTTPPIPKIDVNAPRRTPVTARSVSNPEEVFEFASFWEAAKFLGNDNKRNNIKKCLSGKRHSAYGYVWSYTTTSKSEGQELYD